MRAWQALMSKLGSASSLNVSEISASKGKERMRPGGRRFAVILALWLSCIAAGVVIFFFFRFAFASIYRSLVGPTAGLPLCQGDARCLNNAFDSLAILVTSLVMHPGIRRFRRWVEAFARA